MNNVRRYIVLPALRIRRMFLTTFRTMPSQPTFILWGILLATVAVIYVVTLLFSNVLSYLHEEGKDVLSNSWVFRLFLNLLGYCTIFIPGVILYCYVNKSRFLEKSEHGWFHRATKRLFYGTEKGYSSLDTSETPTSHSQQKSRTLMQEAVLLLFCASGLLASYLIWGLIQEKIMTQKYVNSSGVKGSFQDSQFLVFVNRVLAFVLSGLYILISSGQPKHTVPLYKYIYCSFSNIMSSWCQYEALKYISFPTQVLAKASKIIPVMIMGTIISRKKYDCYEYLTAVLICIGMVFFLFGSADVTKNDQTVTTFSGVVLLIGYMAFDSFTSNWQSALFTRYSATSVQMMCAVNFFSCLLTIVSLVQQDSFRHSLYFMLQFPAFAFDCMLLSVCSAVGQLFIFYTISVFGPVAFVIIMTVRQALAILLSCILYHHIVNLIGVFGISLVFLAIFLRIYWNQIKRNRNKKRLQQTASV